MRASKQAKPGPAGLRTFLLCVRSPPHPNLFLVLRDRGPASRQPRVYPIALASVRDATEAGGIGLQLLSCSFDLKVATRKPSGAVRTRSTSVLVSGFWISGTVLNGRL